ncbi:MAG TPA: DUF4197 domain-containing protein [Acidiferrobacterales bacterium]|nr:DUF4197 domain-containing protein [Acidiferrobacterales bacterium]
MKTFPGVLLFFLSLSACAGSPVGPAARGPVAADPDTQAQAVRQALSQSVDTAVNRLGRADGYWANPQVRIPLPEELRRAEKTLRRYGLERYADEFAESLNRAAEAAVPVAKPVLLAAIRDMSLSDAVGIVRGDEDAATRYFRAHTEAALRERLKPIVADATARANVTAAYKRLMKKAAFLEKAADPGRLDLDAYVTRAALDGLYLLMAEEERRIRRNPAARTTELLKQLFR